MLQSAGFISKELLQSFIKPGYLLGGAKYGDIPGVEATTGSLGHGLSVGIGIAMAQKMDKSDAKTYVIVVDGECEEGTIWEGIN